MYPQTQDPPRSGSIDCRSAPAVRLRRLESDDPISTQEPTRARPAGMTRSRIQVQGGENADMPRDAETETMINNPTPTKAAASREALGQVTQQVRIPEADLLQPFEAVADEPRA